MDCYENNRRSTGLSPAVIILISVLIGVIVAAVAGFGLLPALGTTEIIFAVLGLSLAVLDVVIVLRYRSTSSRCLRRYVALALGSALATLVLAAVSLGVGFSDVIVSAILFFFVLTALLIAAISLFATVICLVETRE